MVEVRRLLEEVLNEVFRYFIPALLHTFKNLSSSGQWDASAVKLPDAQVADLNSAPRTHMVDS